MGTFEPGNKKAHGGKRKGAGRKRKTSEQARTDLAAAESLAAFKRIVKRAKGQLEAPPEIRFACDKLILEYAWGKPTQRLQHAAEMSFITVFGPDAPIDNV